MSMIFEFFFYVQIFPPSKRPRSKVAASKPNDRIPDRHTSDRNAAHGNVQKPINNRRSRGDSRPQTRVLFYFILSLRYARS